MIAVVSHLPGNMRFEHLGTTRVKKPVSIIAFLTVTRLLSRPFQF